MNQMTEALPEMPNSWASLNLNTIVTDRPEGSSGERTELPEGNYTFRLVGGKENPYKAGTTDVDFVISSGPRSKQHLFATIPPPSAAKGIGVQFAAVLVKRLGVPQQAGEELIDYLNRAAISGASAISGDVVHESYFSTKYNEQRSKPKLLWFSLQSAI